MLNILSVYLVPPRFLNCPRLVTNAYAPNVLIASILASLLLLGRSSELGIFLLVVHAIKDR
jgi:hypothetical protein